MPQSGIVKYHVRLSYKIDGLVEPTDIIGAIFGQTEGLLGPEMNLNELQKVSKIGRIKVERSNTSKTTDGTVLVPMSTDIDTCSLIAAAIESIDKVGAFDCEFRLQSIDDVRAAKKSEILKRAKQIKQGWATKTASEGETMLRDIHAGHGSKVESYGPSKLPCSRGIYESPWIILVEGRADIINLLRAGYDNALAINGATIDESIKSICGKKETIVAFMDGDRSGGFILKELKSVVRVDVELRADTGVEVEELTPQRVDEILKPVADEIGRRGRSKQSASDADKPLAELVSRVYPRINETLEAIALDGSQNEVFKAPISELVSKLTSQSGIRHLVLDGIVTQRLLDAARRAGAEFVVGHRVAKLTKANGATLRTFKDLGIA